MIFAKVDVKLRDHVRAHKAGVAMSTWLWALLYVREQETDGVVPDIALRLAWAGEKEARRHADALVLVGLWEVHEDGWRICRYDVKNETREAIASRRKDTRERVSKFRNGSRNTEGNALHGVDVTTGTAVAVPGSDSGSGSDLRSREGERERGPTSVVQRVADPQAAPPEWLDGVLATIHTTYEVLLPKAQAWVRYAAHRASKSQQLGRPIPATREDALHWLSTVMVEEARKQREEVRHQRERDAKFDARRAGPASPADATKLTDAEQRQFAEQLRKRMQNKGAA